MSESHIASNCAVSEHRPKRQFSYIIVDNGKLGAGLFKNYDESGGSIHLAEFSTKAEALEFVATLPTASRVVIL
jgi:hypothetical protein